jgi:signal peptide peptidase SppA
MNLTRFLDTPLALHDRAAAEMLHDIRMRMLEGPPAGASIGVADTVGASADYDVIDSVAVVPISGVLVHGRIGWSEETDYGTIAARLAGARDDMAVKGIALQIASPGGEVSGLFELTDQIDAMRGEKPVWAILDDHAYSAAYAIASAADRITVPRAGGVGSIGVITMHLDVSKLLEEMGINISLVTYGEHKADYSPFRPLSDGARTKLQGDVNTVGEMFTELVGRNRNLTRSRVRATEAATFLGKDGVDVGLADAVMSPREAFEALVQRVK